MSGRGYSPADHDGDAERPFGKLPSGFERLYPLMGIFDYIQHKSEVDDGGGSAGPVRRVVWIPAKRVEPLGGECCDVFSLSATVVEQALLFGHDASAHQQLHRLRKISAYDRGPVSSDLKCFFVSPYEPPLSKCETGRGELSVPQGSCAYFGCVPKQAVFFGRGGQSAKTWKAGVGRRKE